MSDQLLRKYISFLILQENRAKVSDPKTPPYWKSAPPRKGLKGHSGVYGTPDHHAAAGIQSRDPKDRKSTQWAIGAELESKEDQEQYNVASEKKSGDGTLSQKWTKSKRRSLKKNWNERVYSVPEREKFFQEKVDCVHYLGMYSDEKHPEKFIRLLDLHLSTDSADKNPELSTVGYVDKQPSMFSPVGILFKNRRIVYAATGDQTTQFISSADDQIRNFYKSSGLTKLPGTMWNVSGIVFSKEDWERANSAYLGEAIIANYSNSPQDIIIYLDKNNNKQFNKAIITHIESYGDNIQYQII
tara:strand:- start:7969 stop:8868 length:900 start_codon:yes stop_codon:yes gene_type:complete